MKKSGNRHAFSSPAPSPPPVSILVPPYRILLDTEAYTDAQLEAIFRHGCAHKSNGCFHNLLAYLGMAVFWFNPILWYLRREMRRAEEMACDETATLNLNESEKRDYAEQLIGLDAHRHEVPGTANVGKRICKERLTALLQKPKRSSVAFYVIACCVFFFTCSFLIQAMDYYPANEQSLFAVLGANEDALQYNKYYKDRVNDMLMPLDGDGTLYGAIGADYTTKKSGVIWKVSLHYDVSNPASAESGVRALEDDLTARLGSPAIISPAYSSEDDTLSWNVETKKGERATLELEKCNTGSYWSDETSGGMLVGLYLYIESPQN